MSDKVRATDQKRPVGQTDWARLDAMTDEEVEEAARSDPDAPLPKPGRRMRRAPRVRYVRLKLGLTPTAFAERYQIPPEIIESWERHKSEADPVAMAYLNAILADPEGLAKAVAKSLETAGPASKAAE